MRQSGFPWNSLTLQFFQATFVSTHNGFRTESRRSSCPELPREMESFHLSHHMRSSVRKVFPSGAQTFRVREHDIDIQTVIRYINDSLP